MLRSSTRLAPNDRIQYATLYGFWCDCDCGVFSYLFRSKTTFKSSGEQPQGSRLYATCEEVVKYKAAFKKKYSLLTGGYCFGDGLKLSLEQSGDRVIQNMFYNG